MSTPAPLRVAYRDLVVYRGIWKANFAGAFIQPMLYLLGIGLGVGELVDRGPDSAELLGGVSYFGFYSSARTEFRLVRPAELDLTAIGHFGYFRERIGCRLWPVELDWLFG